MKQFDYIIAGAGASGLLLAYRMACDSYFDDKSILLIDKDSKTTNDKTWCFWETGTGEWDDIIYKKWETAFFGSKLYKTSFKFSPYTYKMLRSADFYSFIKGELQQKSNFQLTTEEILKIDDNKTEVVVSATKNTYQCEKVFSSILNPDVFIQQKKYPVLQQHFIGWFIKTKTPVFNEKELTFMDFDIPQMGNTRFMYVLPFSKTEALVEYTLFSEKLLAEKVYEDEIKTYLSKKNITDYILLEKEKGAIPMTCFPFSKQNTENIFYIGTAGGWTKPSTGYTFLNSCRKTKQLVDHLKTGKNLQKIYKKNRFWYYDLLLLDVLYKNNVLGSKIFTKLFKNNKPYQILKFLDEKTSFLQELQLIFSLPKIPFLKAFLRRVF